MQTFVQNLKVVFNQYISGKYAINLYLILSAVENVARDIWTDKNFRCGTVAIPHPKKGEQIIFVSNDKSANKDTFAETVQKKGLSELYIPSLFLYKEEIPFFATGKPDNVSLKKWVLNEIKND